MARYDDRDGHYGGSSSHKRKHHDDEGARGGRRDEYRERSPTYPSRRSRSPTHGYRQRHDIDGSGSSSSSSRRRSPPSRHWRDDRSSRSSRDERHRSDRRSRDRDMQPYPPRDRDGYRSHPRDDRRSIERQPRTDRDGYTDKGPRASTSSNGPTTASSSTGGFAPVSLPPRPPPSLPQRPDFVATPGSPGSIASMDTSAPQSPGFNSPIAANGSGPEDDKARAKRKRLEEWRKKREAEKAKLEAAAIAQKLSAGHTSTPTSLPATNAPTSIRMSGLKNLSSIASKTSTAALDDGIDQAPTKQLKKFALPPMDPLLKPGAGGKVGSGSDLEDDGDDDDEEAVVPSTATAMDVDDDEPDPLDAYMTSIKSEVQTVNDADKQRLGIKAPRVIAPVMGEDEGEGVNDDADAEPDELDQAGLRAEDIKALAAKNVKKRAKDIPTVNHSEMDYPPFEKRFHNPPPWKEDPKSKDSDITVSGVNRPEPFTKWSSCGLPPRVLDVINKLEYKAPTPIQSHAVPAIMSGRDFIGVAKTGSGKTMAFLLPMFRHILNQPPVQKNEGPIGLIMTPTRELAMQIYLESKPFLKVIDRRAVCICGGADLREQIADMKKCPDIVVATPGRLIELLTANSGRVTNLHRVTYLVLDEADRMFDMGFEPQVMKIINNIRPQRQTVLFSATFPQKMENAAKKILKFSPLGITVGGKSAVAKEIEQIIEVREKDTKFKRLLEILGQMFNTDSGTKALIFVDTQPAADELFKQLISKGYAALSLHGGQEQEDRVSTIADFKAGNVDIVIATSVAARGLDIKQLKLVVNYDPPNHKEDYVHRAGRTGRAGKTGTCVTFISPEQDIHAGNLISILVASKVAVPPELQALAEGFEDKVKSGKAQAAGSGFGGKGLERLEDDREENLRAQRSAYGEADDADTAARGQPAPELDIKVERGPAPSDDQLGGAYDLNIEVKKGAAPESIRQNKVRAEGDGEGRGTPDASAAQEKAAAEKAKADEAAKITAAGANPTQLALALAKITAAQQEAQQKRLALKESSEKQKERKPKDPDATDYHAIVPINDFPQKARWRCTNKETMSALITETGASITNKGVFYEPGKEPAVGDAPKLQLLIESNDEDKVEHAVRMIKQILLEATQAALEAEQRNPPPGVGGRYSVV